MATPKAEPAQAFFDEVTRRVIERISKGTRPPRAKPAARKRGRPSISDSPGERYQIRLPAPVAEYLRTVGGGSLSRGILAQVVKNEGGS
jgi:hypothetical protein